jgi:heme exporter protein B
MFRLTQFKSLLKLEFLLEWRSRFAIYTVVVYALSTSYISYLAFQGDVNLKTWNSLLWIIVLFSAVFAAQRSYSGQSGYRFYTFYQLSSPSELLLAKVIYQMGFQAIMSLFIYLTFSLLLGNPVASVPSFILVLALGAMGFAGVLSLTSAIASKTDSSLGLVSILSIPIMLPTLLSAMKASSIALMDPQADVWLYLYALMGLNAIIILLCYLLFPYIWRE